MANIGEIFRGVGGFAGGLAEGIERGSILTQRAQAMELQKRQANLQSLSQLNEVLKPGIDPAIREFTLGQIMPTLGLDKEKAKAMTSLANKMDDESRAVFSEFITNNPDIAMGKQAPKVLLDRLIADPVAGFKFMNEWVASSKQEKRADAAELRAIADEGRKDKKLELDEKSTLSSIANDARRTNIAEQGLVLDAAKLDIEQQKLDDLVVQRMITNRQKGMTALANVAGQKNPKLRMVMANTINTEFGLGLDEADLTAFAESPAEGLQAILDKLEVEKKTLEVANKDAGLDLPTTTQKAMLGIRARGETTESMPKSIKEMTPEQAATALASATKLQIDKGSLENKGSRDKAKLDIMDIDVAMNMNERLMKIIKDNPDAAGLLGSTARLGQKLTGAVSSFEPVIAGARQEIGTLLATSDPATKSAVTQILNNKNVSVAEVLETALRLRYARTLSDSARINKDQYDVAADQIQITGFRGQENALTKLETVQEVFRLFREGKQSLLHSGRAGELSADDATDEEDYGNLLDELDPDGTDPDFEEEE